MNIQELKALKSVALVGATDREEKYGNIILKFLQRYGHYDIYPVNPNLKLNELLGLKVYRNLAEVPVKLDLIVAVVPAKVTNEVLSQAIELGVANFWCQPGASNNETQQIACGKINLVVDECIMVALRR